ncbi:MAG: Rab family GTPase [bacterium]
MKVKICVVGEHAVGKTSLIRRYVYDEFDDRYILTLGAKVTKKEMEVPHPEGQGPIRVLVSVWDIMGEKGFRELLKEAYFRGAQGILAVCDITRRDTLSELDGWISSMERVTGKVPIHFLANKIDLKDEITFRERDLQEKSESHSSPYLLTSAKTGANVDLAFESLSQRIVAQRVSKVSQSTDSEKPAPR